MRIKEGCHRKINTNPKFSIVICTYNDARYLPNAIESVMEQKYSNWELIIVNDGSTDNTLEILESYKETPNVSITFMEKNKGKASCLNIALQKAKGTWLVELDSDDWLPKRALEILDKAVKLGVEAYYGNYAEWREHFHDKQLSFSKLIKGVPCFNARTYLENAYPLAPRVYRVDTLRKIGGWHMNDIYQSKFYEDVYILCALSNQGKVVYLNELLYHRRLRSGSVSASGKKELFKKWREWVKEELDI